MQLDSGGFEARTLAGTKAWANAEISESLLIGIVNTWEVLLDTRQYILLLTG